MKQRKNRDYAMQLAIVQNPHVKDPRRLWNILKQQEESVSGGDAFDEEGFELLKDSLRQSPRFIVKS